MCATIFVLHGLKVGARSVIFFRFLCLLCSQNPPPMSFAILHRRKDGVHTLISFDFDVSSSRTFLLSCRLAMSHEQLNMAHEVCAKHRHSQKCLTDLSIIGIRMGEREGRGGKREEEKGGREKKTGVR